MWNPKNQKTALDSRWRTPLNYRSASASLRLSSIVALQSTSTLANSWISATERIRTKQNGVRRIVSEEADNLRRWVLTFLKLIWVIRLEWEETKLTRTQSLYSSRVTSIPQKRASSRRSQKFEFINWSWWLTCKLQQDRAKFKTKRMSWVRSKMCGRSEKRRAWIPGWLPWIGSIRAITIPSSKAKRLHSRTHLQLNWKPRYPRSL